MKLADILKKVGLYTTALHMRNLTVSSLLAAKRSVYHIKLAGFMRAGFVGDNINILVVMNAGGIGNVVEATPLVNGLRMLWPNANITILSLEGDLFDDWCVPDRIVKSIQEIKGEHFDHTFCPYWDWKIPSDWTGLCDFGTIHQTKVALKKWFLKSERFYNIDMIKSLGFKGLAPPLYVSVNKPEIDLPDCKLRICVVPCGKNEDRWRYKKWLGYARLISLLLKKNKDCQICILGTADDIIEGDLPVSERLLDLRGRLSLSQTAWMLRNSDIAVGNDCGPMHIASAVQTRSLVIFGPTCVMKNLPPNNAKPITAGLNCQPCQYDANLDNCQCPDCINKITPDIVIGEMEKQFI